MAAKVKHSQQFDNRNVKKMKESEYLKLDQQECCVMVNIPFPYRKSTTLKPGNCDFE